MKKFFLSLLVLIIAFTGISQPVPYPTPLNPFGSRGTMTNAQGGWKVDSTFIPPAYSDTNSANRQKTSLYPGSLIRVGNVIYQRSSDTTYWILVGGGSSLCPGTQLLSGSITWSGSGLVYDATDLEYYILCLRYSSSATTITLTAANPSFDRIDKFYADNTGNVGVITGTPAANPQEPAVNPLTQIDLGIVYVPAGSLVPAGTTQTIIYNENVEWSGTSDVPSINFAYGTNPYTGSVSTYVPSAPNSSYIEWAGGSDYNFSQAQYLKFWVRLNANFSTEPLSFLDVTFEYTDVTVSQTLAVGNGDFNMDYSLINQWQLVSIPLTGITTYGATFNEVHFVINSAPSSFQLDYVYLLETNTVPPVVGDYWGFQGNSVASITNPRLGTTSDNDLTIIAGDSVGIVVPSRGVTQSADTSHKQLLWDSTTKKLYWGYQPTIYADAPLYIYTDSEGKKHIADTSSSSGGNCGLITGGEVTLIDTTTFNVSAALYCIGNVTYSSLGSVVTLATPGDTVRIDVIGVDTSGNVFTLTGTEAVNPSPPSIDPTYQISLSFVLVSTDSITPYNPSLSWSTSGNSGTNPYVNFIGTTDNKGFMIKTNNIRSGFIDNITFSSSWGIEALLTNAGSNNNAVGYGAGFLNSTGSDNNYLGNAAGYSNATGARNTAVGGISNYANTSGSENVAIGYRALQNNQASGLVAIGVESLQLNTDGEYNTAVGHSALNRNTDGTKNTALGYGAVERTTTGDDNVGISYYALRLNTTGNGNIGIGVSAISNSVSGNLNTSIGNNSGTTLTSGSYNTLVGGNANVASSSTDSAGAFGLGATATSRQMAFSPYFNAMYLNLDSAVGTAPAIAGIDASGNWRKYATPAGGTPTLTQTYIGVGNGSNQLSGSANFADDGSILTYNGAGGMSIPNGGLSVAGGTVSAIEYTGDWAGSVINPQFGGTGVNNSGKTITLGGNLTTSGAFASTFTMTAATGVTFPTTGTLATLAGSETFTNKTIGGSSTINSTGAITTTANVTGNLGLFGGGVRTGNNTNFYWNSGPQILGNTNDITFKNAATTAGANVSIGTAAAAASSILDITSTVKGVLLPRMTSTQRDAISSPATGLTLFCTDCTATDASTGVMQTYNGATWKNYW